MISFDEYAYYDRLGLARLVAQREVGAEELRETALAAIEGKNPALNAVLQVLSEQSACEIDAGLAQGPFHGVPFAIKELALQAAEVPLDLGSRLGQGTVFPMIPSS